LGQGDWGKYRATEGVGRGVYRYMKIRLEYDWYAA